MSINRLHIILFIIAFQLTIHEPCSAVQAGEHQAVDRIADPPELIEPSMRSLINTLTPTFRWRSVDSDNGEYRLIIAERNGKIIFDKWIGADTSFVFIDPSIFNDLTIYLWSVSAYCNSNFTTSETNSFCIDINISLDLEIIGVSSIVNKKKWRAGDDIEFLINLLNCGPEPCFDSKLVLCNGNTNENYRNHHSIQKSQRQDSVLVRKLKSGASKKTTLRGTVNEGLNHFFVQVETRDGFIDIYPSNNFKSIPIIQTKDERIQLNALYIVYPHYQNKMGDIISLKENSTDTIYQTMQDVHNFFWEHTHVVDIHADTIYIPTILSKGDFRFIDDKWGYVLNTLKVENDLNYMNISAESYNFIYTYYSWENSEDIWSGYHGYTYSLGKYFFDEIPFSAQPITDKTESDLEISIHELLHIFEHLYQENSDKIFYSPDNREGNTTFAREMDYYEWMLETWPTEYWIDLNNRQRVTASSLISFSEDQIPRFLSLSQNYPNPFNNATVITYEIPQFKTKSKVTLKVYNLMGVCVRTLIDDVQESGNYSITWDGTDDMGITISSGIYFYKIFIEGQSLVKKLLYIK